MNIIFVLGAAVLLGWSVWYVIRTVYRQLKGGGCCGGSCNGNCGSCGKSCSHRSTR